MRFTKKPKREIWIGSLRCNVDEDTEKELRDHQIVSVKRINGMNFYHYGDGSIEVKSTNEELKEKVAEIRSRK